NFSAITKFGCALHKQLIFFAKLDQCSPLIAGDRVAERLTACLHQVIGTKRDVMERVAQETKKIAEREQFNEEDGLCAYSDNNKCGAVGQSMTKSWRPETRP